MIRVCPEGNWQQLVSALADGVIISHHDGTILYVNQHAAELFGRSASSFIGENFLYPLAANETQEIDIIKPNGQVLTAEMNVKLGAWREQQAWIISLRDITDKKRKMEQLEIGSKVFNHAHDGIMVTDAHFNLVDMNQAFIDMTGYSKKELLGRNTKIFRSDLYEVEFYKTMRSDVKKEGYWTGEIWGKHKNGSTFPVYLTMSAVKNRDNEVINYIGICHDLILLKKQQAIITRMKYYDPLTDIPNQYFLSEHLGSLMSENSPLGASLIIVYLALDGLNSEKNNKLLDEQKKDNVVIGIAHRLASVLPKDILLARVSYSDFIAVFKNVVNVEDITPAIQSVIEECGKPYEISKNKITLKINIGLTSYPQEHIIYPEELIRQSHFAAYEAKFSGENQYKFYDKSLELQKIQNNQQIRDLRIAMTQHQLEVFYQPKVDMQTGKILGAEALVRLRHPEKGTLGPDSFLPEVFKHPIYAELGEWVIHQVLADLEKKLIAQDIYPISINISPYHLTQESFLNDLKEILAEHPKVKSEFIELEILETEVLSNLSQVKKLINECKKIGVLFALDDFGTGYSSLTYLRELSANKVKLDQSFVRDIINKSENIVILKACIDMCKLLKREVIAEGVETIAIGKLLLYLGCTNAQGYAISEAMPVDELCEWSKNWHSFPEWNMEVASKKEGALLLNAIIAHCARIDVIKNYLTLNHNASVMDILKVCPVELWINRQRHLKPEQDAKLKRLQELHTEIYVETVDVFTLHEQGKNSEAVKRLELLESRNISLLNQLLALNL
ncbi:putative bifunctional diguanylate cyclase/phosphodiesterase [Legionella fallonii]|uniref:Putative Sensory box protein (GGDEF domain/EAL domain) n=1 Tax=Legionella fallonii LLAP-10 TaxID=1212491 RepID=A0A098GAM1_9GAMM|nr:EAL domain-containing protein [Legionella fallonii]CEG58530.1 putative Sensory box protein (GGDEF domain/EAL domain) [Legionella fallonii LLAP-10]